MSNTNKNLNQALKAKKDEFFTQLDDIEKELIHYKKYFNEKIVYCNCDDPATSNFVRYFLHNFDKLGLKKLIATCYTNPYSDNAGKGMYMEYTGNQNVHTFLHDIEKRGIKYLKGNGDFRSDECIEILKTADIVATNPPFSLFREYITQLIELNKKFIVLGHQNAITYKEIFLYIKENKLWLGIHNGGTKWFEVPEDYDIVTKSRKKKIDGKKFFSMGSIMWYTNLDTQKRHKDLKLHKKYTPESYPEYDNYNAIEVSRYTDIPKDYKGVMGVPVTFLDKYNPEQFEIVGSNRGVGQDPDGIYGRGSYINGKETFKRLFIINKKPVK